MGWERAAQFCHLCQQPPGMHDCSHCGGEPCLSAQTLALSPYCWQSSCRSLATPLTLTLPGHFNCNPQLKVFIKFSLSPASSSVRSAACRPDRQSSEEHLQFKRDAYATVVSGLKVNRLLRRPGPSLPCRVSGVFYIPLFETLYFLPGFLPARSAQLLQGWRGALASRPELSLHRGCRRQITGSFPRLLTAKPRERMATTAAVLAHS